MNSEPDTTVVSDHLTDAIEQLSSHIRQADFVAAISLLEKANPGNPGLGRASRLREEPVRLSQRPTLGFRNNSLEALEKTTGPHPYRLYCNFFGLFGNNGPLPLHLTEYAMQRTAHHHDPTFMEFVDLFNHRMLSLFYLATVEADPIVNIDRGEENRYLEFVSAVCGLLPKSANDRDSLGGTSKLKYAAWLGARTRSPDGLASMLGDTFGVDCEIEEFVGGWLPIPGEGQIRLGSRSLSCELGVSTYAGRRVWSISHKICIHMGPVSRNDYNQFAPGGQWNLILRDMVRSYLGDEIDWDLKLMLASGQGQRLALNGSRHLGFNSWLVGSDGLPSCLLSSVKNRRQLSGPSGRRH